jgi:hypothetical protein
MTDNFLCCLEEEHLSSYLCFSSVSLSALQVIIEMECLRQHFYLISINQLINIRSHTQIPRVVPGALGM